MFLGQARHSLDDKGRLTIPARYRDDLAMHDVYLMLGFDHNLLLLTSPQFELISQHIHAMSLADPNARGVRRLIFSTAEKLEIDKAGRILIPQYLRQMASIDGDVIIAGVGNAIEIWSPVLWDAQSNQLQDAQMNAVRFSALDLPTS